jgi:phosphorylcholine metabolism protein LicD
MAKINLKRMGPTYRQNVKRNKMIAKVTEHIVDTLESFNKHYWLAGGTLLGWYRDCGIIPHTQDVDMVLKI